MRAVRKVRGGVPWTACESRSRRTSTRPPHFRPSTGSSSTRAAGPRARPAARRPHRHRRPHPPAAGLDDGHQPDRGPRSGRGRDEPRPRQPGRRARPAPVRGRPGPRPRIGRRVARHPARRRPARRPGAPRGARRQEGALPVDGRGGHRRRRPDRRRHGPGRGAGARSAPARALAGRDGTGGRIDRRPRRARVPAARRGGRLVAWKRGDLADELAAARRGVRGPRRRAGSRSWTPGSRASPGIGSWSSRAAAASPMAIRATRRRATRSAVRDRAVARVDRGRGRGCYALPPCGSRSSRTSTAISWRSTRCWSMRIGRRRVASR